ncbi:hypothetical protein [Paraburkholderia unamae]|uniref:Uncharacterized protein n=1 Tax=Paraburkholderia unamae TaxID=219649 RepID=A0ACC6RGQ0_9BURK
MESLQEGRKGEFAGGEVNEGTSMSKGGSSGGVDKTSGVDKFHERPNGHAGKEFSVVVNDGDGMSK